MIRILLAENVTMNALSRQVFSESDRFKKIVIGGK
jgi:hypothetical protein